jgi:peptidyl-dipeptidase A
MLRHSVRKAAAILTLALAGCGGGGATGPAPQAPSTTPIQEEVKPVEYKADAKAFLDTYLGELAVLEKTYALSWWNAQNSGKKEEFDAYAAADLALKKMHSDTARYQKLAALRDHEKELDPQTARAIEVAYLSFKGNQLPADVLEDLVNRSNEIEQLFNVYRVKLDGKELSNNDALEKLAKETKSDKRQAVWDGLKQVGEQVAPKLIALAKVRNKAAKMLGYENFWDMQIRLQEHDPAQILAIFDELEKMTNAPFKAMKAEMDAELAKKFKIKPEAMMPWHYDNPFFQAAPPSATVDLTDFYKDKPKEEIIEITKKFYSDIGLPCDDIVARSDLYERPGKSQHAFCISIDRGDDIRTLLNIKPDADWMETALHEEGHAIYSKGIDKTLIYNLRGEAHTFTTEAIAMLFGALASNPSWMIAYAKADEKKVKKVEGAILEQRRREQLIFARWTIVMLNFEKALYENPDQDLNKLWWDMVERYQMLKRPANRNLADWASKPHFSVAPVYYHNYMLGELFAAQLRGTLAKMANHTGPTSQLSFNGRKDFGTFLNDKVFKPGMIEKWPEFVEHAVGEPLTAKYFAQEVTK